MLVLIKNGFSVPSDYVPSDLRDVNIPYESEVGQLRDCAATALENMYKDGLKQGYSIAIKSSYRSYETQSAVYNEYFAMYDAAYAASLVSVPGSSEHQCGLSVDLTSQSVMDGTYEVLEEPIETASTGENFKDKWEFDADAVAAIADSVQEISMYDEELDTTFIIHVTLPPDFDAEKTYPMFVMTDGVWRFGDHPALWNLMQEKAVEDVILVSIGYDFQLDGTDNAVRATYFCEKKDLFLSFITDNLMPYLNASYSIDFSQSALYGHSLGGTFTHYAAFQSDLFENQPFQYYIIGSPAFWSPYFLESESNPPEYQTEYGYFDRNTSFNKTLYVCGGEQEDADYASYYGENDSTLEGITHLMERLKADGVTTAECKIYADSNHYAYIPEMFQTFFLRFYRRA